MKISIVIPTRNRLELLKSAVDSIFKQNDPDWEIVISDNASIEHIQGYIQSLNEPRIKYSRSSTDLSITENWNRCIDQSTGEYILMIGDDDILLKNYLQIIRKLIKNYEQPDLIYTNAFLYAYPEVIPDFPKGVFQPFGSLYGMPKSETPFWMDLDCRKAILQETLKFRSIYSTNMQHALIRRELFEKVKRQGKFFHSPYPDIYAMSALVLEAEQILVYPKELVVIGISSKSHGCYAINNRDKEAVAFLNIKNEINEISSLRSILLPGFIVYTFWLGAIELFKIHFNLEKLQLKLDYKIYRRQQMNYVLYHYKRKSSEFSVLYKQLKECITLSEKIYLFFYSSVKDTLKRKLPKLIAIYKRFKSGKSLNQVGSQYTPLNPPPGYLVSGSVPNQFDTILEVFEKIEPIDCIPKN